MASPKTIIELSNPNSSFWIPANPVFIVLLLIITVRDLSTSRIGIPKIGEEVLLLIQYFELHDVIFLILFYLIIAYDALSDDD